MVEFVVHQLRQRCALAAVQFIPLVAGQGAEAGEVPDAGAHFQKLESKSLMLDAAGDRGARVDHGAPVENPDRRESTAKANKKQTLFFALYSPEENVQKSEVQKWKGQNKSDLHVICARVHRQKPRASFSTSGAGITPH
jgi:hypothetical protein